MDTSGLIGASLLSSVPGSAWGAAEMDAAGRALVWCAVQVTLVLTAALLLDAVARRRGPALRSSIGSVALTAAVGLSLLALSPWPNWRSVDPVRPAAPSAETGHDSPINAGQPATTDAPTETTVGEAAAAGETESVWAAAWRAFRDELQAPRALPETTTASAAPPAPLPETRVRWPGVVAWCYVVLLMLGALRWGAGLVLLRRMLRRAALVEDAALQGRADELAAALGVRRRVRLYESARLNGPAMTGWLRPVILLPTGWREWSDTQRRAVLAHELAHVRRGDALAWLLAELGRTLHAYHPLAHWLAARTRLHQELAADAEAAALSGGARSYLHVLAGMALAQSDRSVRWPARAFLPSRSAFLRRIDMLRQGTLPSPRAPLSWRLAAAGCLVAMAVLAAGLRGASAQVEDEAGPARPNANQPAPPSGGYKSDPADGADKEAAAFEVDLVPDDALLVVGIRPAEILGSPEFEPLLKVIQQGGREGSPFGVALDSIEQVVFSLRADPVPQLMGQPMAGMPGGPGGEAGSIGPGMFPGGMPGQVGVVRQELEFAVSTVRVRGKLDQKAVVELLAPEVETGFYGGQLYLKRKGAEGPAFWFLDERTFAMAVNEAGARRMIDARNTPGRIGKNVPGWEAAQHAPLAALVNVARARSVFGEQAIQSAGPAGLNVLFSPLWTDTDTIAGHASLDGGLKLSLTFVAGRRDQVKGPPIEASRAVEAIQATLEAMVTIGQNVVRQNRQMVEHLPEDERGAVRGLLTLADRVLAAVAVERQEDATVVVVKADLGRGAAGELVAMLLPAVVAARKAARRAEAMNDLKQIGLALHNYHDIHRHFPPAVVIGPDGKTPHSWRVEILPFIEEIDLFQRYRMDEPWDSEHNMALLKEMPEVFRHPLDDKDSVHSSYFGLVGPNTIFGTDARHFEGGVAIRDITDGTSNTLMVVEAKKDIPWTKPEDVPFDPQGELPKLGGWFDEGFLAVLGDGSARFISDSIGEVTLRRLTERNDGNPVQLPDDSPQPADRPTIRSSDLLPPPAAPESFPQPTPPEAPSGGFDGLGPGPAAPDPLRIPSAADAPPRQPVPSGADQPSVQQAPSR